MSGSAGEAARFAMSILVDYGTAVGADRLIAIDRAHIDSCLFSGESGLDFAQYLVNGGAKVSVPTTLNVGSVDLIHRSANRGDRRTTDRGRLLMRTYQRMGCSPTWTCAPYQLANRPHFGEHIAWAESNAIAFANSVIGARTDRYGDFIDICAAIAGKVPENGLHVTKNRRAQVVFDISRVSKESFSHELFWPLLGAVVGARTQNRVPAVVGLASPVSEDDLKAFGAAAASFGSVGLFHVIGVTPEASTLDDALQGKPADASIEVTAEMLSSAQKTLVRGTGEFVAVSIGTPHFSIAEFARLVALVQGKRCHPSIEFCVSTSRHTMHEVELRGWLKALTSFGVVLVTDTCTYVAPILRNKRGLVLTNSAKWAYYAPGNLGYDVAFGSLRDCVESAVSGSVTLNTTPFGE